MQTGWPTYTVPVLPVLYRRGRRYVLVPALHSLEVPRLRKLDVTKEDVITIVHFTRNWLHYGTISFISGCALIGAVRGLLAIS